MKIKIISRAAFVAVLMLSGFAAGCSLLWGGSPTATIRNYHLRAESNNPEAMTKLFSRGYLERNKKALENSRYFADLVQKARAAGDRPELFDLKETYAGEKAIVKGRYGDRRGGGSLPFQFRLVKEDGEWKIEFTTGSLDEDLTKEEPPVTRSKELVRELDAEHLERNKPAVFSPDGKTVAYISRKIEGMNSEFSINLLNAETGSVKSKIPVKAESRVGAVNFSPDGNSIVGTDGENQIYVWNLSSAGAPAQTITFTPADSYENAVALAFAPDGTLYGGGSKGNLYAFDIKTGKVTKQFEGHRTSAKAAPKSDEPPTPGGGQQINEITVAPDGKMLATVTADNEIKIWDAASGKQMQKLFIPREVVNGVTKVEGVYAAFAPDGKSLLTYSGGRLLQRWDARTGAPVVVKELEQVYVGWAEFSRDGKLMTDMGGESDKPPLPVRIYDTATGALKATFTGLKGDHQTTFSPDGRFAASVSDKDYEKIFLWDTSGIK